MSEEQEFFKIKDGVDCAKQCVIKPFSERVIGQLYTFLKKRDELSLKYAQAVQLMTKKHLIDEINLLNAQIKDMLFIP